MEKVYISWTLQNWITVVLMVIIAGLVVNLAAYSFDRISA